MPEVKLDHFPLKLGVNIKKLFESTTYLKIIENWSIFPKLQVEKKQNIILKPNHRLETHSKRSPTNVLKR